MNSIKKLREAKELTQKELAEQLGLTRSAIVKWEAGKSVPKTEMLPEIAKIFGCTIDDLFADAAG